MLLEAGLSGLAGVLVFFVSLISVGFDEAPVLPLLLLGVIAAVGLHPRIFTPGIRRCCARSAVRICHLSPTRRWSACSATTA